MKPTAHRFKPQAEAALKDEQLRQALGYAKGGFVNTRRVAVSAYPGFDDLRSHGARIKDHTLAYLDVYLERFESQVNAAGGRVHWAEDAASACAAIVEICRNHGARRVTKSKTMAGEEIAINDALDMANVDAVETDLGEYIIQLAKEPPSHIIAPAVHKTREEVTGLFNAHHHAGRHPDRLRSATELVNEARRVLRERFLSADVGITGANFLIADTGSVITVTNEGNAELTNTLPRVHIVIAGIEKLVPTLDDAAVLLRLLARSATGQEMSAYTSIATGPKRPEDTDGPEAFHVVLIDNGRSRMLGGEFREMLRCIRCGACLNHCPVYTSIGGHAYGWVYSGPMGSVLTPLFIGLDRAYDLPNACTLNGRCQQICPMRIPIPNFLRGLRNREYEQHMTPAAERVGLRLWAFFARRPRAYRLATRIGGRVLRLLGARKGSLPRFPLARGWTAARDIPIPQGNTFLAEWAKRKGREPHE